MKKLTYIFIYTLLGLGFYWLYQTHGRDFISLLQAVSWPHVIALLCIQIPLVSLMTIPFAVLLRAASIRVKVVDMLALSFTSNLANHLLPYRPGIGVRWFFLRKHYHLSNQLFLTSTLLYFMMLMLYSAGILLISGHTLDLPSRFYVDEAIPLSIAAILLALTFVALAFAKVKFQRLLDFSDYIKQLTTSPSLLFAIFLLLSLLFFLLGYAMQWSFLALNHELPLMPCLFLIATMILSSTIHITPSNIGISEFIIGSITEFLYQDFMIGFAALLVFRFSQISIALLIGLPASLYILKHESLPSDPLG